MLDMYTGLLIMGVFAGIFLALEEYLWVVVSILGAALALFLGPNPTTITVDTNTTYTCKTFSQNSFSVSCDGRLFSINTHDIVIH